MGRPIGSPNRQNSLTPCEWKSSLGNEPRHLRAMLSSKSAA
jgi:hypothetical protein